MARRRTLRSAPAAMTPNIKRDARGLFLEGSVGNPLGRGACDFVLMREARAHGSECVNFLIGVVRGEEDRASVADQIRACELLLTRGFGRPPQNVTIDGDGKNGPVRFTLNINPPTGDEPDESIDITDR